MNNITLLFLIAHVLGDFYFQSNKLSRTKAKKYRYVLLHSVLYAVPFLLIFSLVFSWEIIIGVIAIVVSHFVVDTAKFFFQKTRISQGVLFVLDQILHVSIIYAVCQIFFFPNVRLPMLNNLRFAFSSLILNGYQLLRLIFLILLVCKPISVAFENVFKKYKPEIDEEDAKPTGAIIGIMERLLIVIMLILNQYTAIGLILTGKSVARYEKMKQQDFAEYYLLGTFFSMLGAIISFLLVWR